MSDSDAATIGDCRAQVWFTHNNVMCLRRTTLHTTTDWLMECEKTGVELHTIVITNSVRYHVVVVVVVYAS